MGKMTTGLALGAGACRRRGLREEAPARMPPTPADDARRPPMAGDEQRYAGQAG